MDDSKAMKFYVFSNRVGHQKMSFLGFDRLNYILFVISCFHYFIYVAKAYNVHVWTFLL